MAFLEFRKFVFFDTQNNIDNGKIAERLQDTNVKVATSGKGLVVLCDVTGWAHLISHSWQINSFKAYELTISLAQQLPHDPYLVTVGRSAQTLMGRDTSAAGGRTAGALRLLALIVLALVAFQYLVGWTFGATTINTYLYDPIYNATQITFRNNETPLPDVNTTQSTQIKNHYVTMAPLPRHLCDSAPPDLGPVPVNKTEVKLASIENKYPEIRLGGCYTPPNCTARHKVAIIVPYKDREQHLAIFLKHMHPFLMKQQISYGIFIVEQAGNKSFNRAKLMNVGFVESQKLERGGWQCFIFHDIDLLPLDTRNMYTCPEQPRHMSAAVDKFKYKLPYQKIFGGVSALTEEQFTKVNGFSNKYWGWGGEDDDMFTRLQAMHYNISRYDMNIAKYVMLDHKKSKPNLKRKQLLTQTSKLFQEDGLSTLEYDLIKMVRYHLYTYLLADIDEQS